MPNKHNHNPSGKNGHTKGLQRYGTRAGILLTKFGPEYLLKITEIKNVGTDKKPKWKYPLDLYKNHPSWDVIIIMHLGNVLRNERAERESLVNRIEGMPKQTTAIEEPPTPPNFTVKFE